jgi:hypothetical protein
MRSRTATAVVGLVASLAVSVALWYYFGTFLFFLFVPFVPFLFRGGDQEHEEWERRVRRCPTCGFETERDDFDYCPRDGTRLE